MMPEKKLTVSAPTVGQRRQHATQIATTAAATVR